MVDAVVHFALNRLTDAVIQETLFLYGFRDNVEHIQRDLAWIRSFLTDADAKCQRDESVKRWVNEVKEVGFWIEDALDAFLIQVEEANRNRLRRIPKKLIVKHKLGIEIDKIHHRLREISENTETYGIKAMRDNSSSGFHSSNLPARPLMIPDIVETDVVGFEADKRSIIEQLTDPDITRRSVISIVGAGGSGKTTLAKEVYKSAKAKCHFAIHLWVTVSEDYTLIDILFKMLEEITQIDSDIRHKGEEYLAKEIYKSLKDKIYLVVLDDVWSSDLWTQLEDALCKTNNGSRVLITTRFINIAEVMDPTSKPYEIKALNKEESEQLLLKKVFPNQYANECPEDVLDLASQFANKCGGWPLALVVVGGILSRKFPNYNTWSEVMRKMNWHTDGSKCMGIISTSYDHLPANLKPCFMYFAAFPEDYQIKAKTLKRLWIAEGFILHDESKILEDVAENYLEELVQRCMVQVSSRYVNGKIKYCHVHDLLRELATQKAKEDNFLTVFIKNDNRLMSDGSSARRVALDCCDEMTLEHVNTNIRSLHYFGDHIPTSNKFWMLRVLNIHSSQGRITTETIWHNLTALKYLEFRMDGMVCRWLFGGTNDSIGFWLSPLTLMKNLQTVHIEEVCRNDSNLPTSFWDNKQLRHVIFGTCRWCGGEVEGPPSSANLPNLVTLKGVTARHEWCTTMPHLPQLHKLRVNLPITVESDSMLNSLSNLQDLGSLSLCLAKRPDHTRITFPCGTSALGSHQCLYSLCLKWGRWPNRKKKTLDYYYNMLPHQLLKLTLSWFHFEEDPMPLLENLPNLTVLKILNSRMTALTARNQMMRCSKGGFGRLRKLLLQIENLVEWKIEEGAMSILNQLELECDTDLRAVPNLEFLTNLKELKVCIFEVKNSVISRIEKEDHWRIKHVPYVQIL